MQGIGLSHDSQGYKTMLGMKRVRAGAFCALLLLLTISWSTGAQEVDRQAVRPAWFPTTAEESQALHARIARGARIDGIAATFTVDTTLDAQDANPGDGTCAASAGACTLRAAIMEANALPGADTILLPSGTYVLTIVGTNEDSAATGDLDITDPDGLIIIGPANGAPAIIDGNNIDRVLDVRTGASVSLSDIAIESGNVAGTAGGGVLINAGAFATLDGVSLTNNQASLGGGVYAAGNISIFNSLIALNAAGDGGGLYLTGEYLISNTTITSNEIAGDGGGLFIFSSFTGSVEHSTISHNSTFLSIMGGGGMYVASPVFVRSTILANNNSSLFGPDCLVDGAEGQIISEGDNLIGNNAGCAFPLGNFSDQIGTVGAPINPLLGSLADNGGRTQSRAPLPGSPARDAMSDANCAEAGPDQRGVPRPQDANADGVTRCDIGAVEVIQPFTLAGPIPNGFQHSNTLNLVWTAADGATKYKIEVKGTNKPFSYTRTKNAAKTCLGFVCRDTRTFANLPNLTTLRWRVTAQGLPTPRVTPWQSFRVEIPRKPTLVTPHPYGVIADPTPQLRWENDTVNEYVVRVRNNAGKVLKSFTLNRTSTPTINEVCVGFFCTLSTEDFALALVVGRSYSWSVEATLVTVSGGMTTRYRSRSAWSPFTVVSDPVLLDGAGADGLRGVDPAR
jgi:CSLREA domain-containing protein